MLKPFTGFRGVATHVQVGGVSFVVMARSTLALEQFYAKHASPGDPPFDAAKCKKSILIQSELLPEPKP